MARHETNNYKSNVYTKTNNLFGIKAVGDQEGIPADGGLVRIFKNDGESITALLQLFRWKKFPEVVAGPVDFVRNLKQRGYFTDTEANYLRGLKRFL